MLAALAAIADGALLSELPLPAHLSDRSERADGSSATGGYNGHRSVAARERTHRALAFARVVGHLAAGSGIAVALNLLEQPTLGRALSVVGFGLGTVLLAESVARVVGDSLGPDGAVRLAGVTGVIGTILRPVILLGDWMDGLFADYIR